MKKILKNKKALLLAADAMLIPVLLLCRGLSSFMLTLDLPCQWAQLGGKCVTCGGTHFVKALLEWKFSEAFLHNPFLFLLAGYLVISYVLLHLDQLWSLPFAKKVLSALYSIPALVVGVVIMLAFFVVRNLPLFVRILEYLLQG